MISVLPLLRRLSPRPRPESWEGATDVELALAARAQDRAGKEAFVEIVRRHQTAVAAVAFSVTGRIGLTDDIAQETFLRGWKRLATLREPAKLKAWLTKIAHDCAVDALRREKPHTSLDDERVSLTEAAESAPDKAAAEAEDEQMVWSALSELPETVRTPLVLFYREGQSVAAVAAALDLSEDAVKQRLSRGREALREQVTSRIEGVLGRVRPSALLVVTIAAAIGLLAAPAALAAGAFTGTAATAGAAGGGSAASASTFSTAMTASSYLVATITLAAFIPLGWKAGAPEAPAPPAPVSQKAAPVADPFADFAGSSLLKEWRRLHEVHGTDAAAMPGLYDEIAKSTDAFRRRALRSALIAEWSVVDPRGAFRYLQFDKKQGDQTTLLMREWLQRDPAAAAKHVVANAAAAPDIARSFLTELVKIAPEQMVEAARQIPAAKSEWDRAVQDAFAAYAGANPEAARLAADSLPAANREQALAGTAEGWAQRDGQAALAWSRTLPAGPERDSALRATLTGWAKSDPAAALSNIDAAPPGKKDMYFASDTAAKVLISAAEKDFDATMRWLTDNHATIGRESWYGLSGQIQKRLTKDPAGTLEFIASQPDGVRVGLNTALNSVLLNEGFAQKDAVWAWLKAQSKSPYVDALAGMMLQVTSWREPEEAMKYLTGMEDNPAARSAIEQHIRTKLDEGQSLQQLDVELAKLPEQWRAGMLAIAFNREGDWQKSDVEPLAERMKQLPAAEQPQAAASVAGRMAATDPQAAISWASSLADAELKDRAFTGLTMRWARIDSYEASQWVESLPPGHDRDVAAGALVASIVNNDPESAWTWAVSIESMQQRMSALSTALSFVHQRDPQRARQLLNATSLSGGVRAALQQELDFRNAPVGAPKVP